MTPNEPEIEFSLWPPKVRGKGRLAVVGGFVIAALLIMKADLPAWETWTQIANRW